MSDGKDPKQNLIEFGIQQYYHAMTRTFRRASTVSVVAPTSLVEDLLESNLLRGRARGRRRILEMSDFRRCKLVGKSSWVEIGFSTCRSFTGGGTERSGGRRTRRRLAADLVLIIAVGMVDRDGSGSRGNVSSSVMVGAVKVGEVLLLANASPQI